GGCLTAPAAGDRAASQDLHAGTQAPERQVVQVGRVRAGRLDHQDSVGQGGEVGPEVDRAFQHQDPVVPGIGAQVPEHRLVGGLLLAAGNQDVHAVPAYADHGTQVHAAAQVERTRADEAAIAQ